MKRERKEKKGWKEKEKQRKLWERKKEREEKNKTIHSNPNYASKVL